MKKVLSILLSITLLLSLAIPVFAAETDTRSTVVSLELDPSMESYTLEIPAQVELDVATKIGAIAVKLTDVSLVWNHSVTVYMTTENGVSGEPGSYLVNSDDESLKIHYTLTDAIGRDYVHGQGDPVAEYFINTSTGEVIENGGGVTLEIDGDYPGAGTYTDTITFTVELQ